MGITTITGMLSKEYTKKAEPTTTKATPAKKPVKLGKK